MKPLLNVFGALLKPAMLATLGVSLIPFEPVVQATLWTFHLACAFLLYSDWTASMATNRTKGFLVRTAGLALLTAITLLLPWGKVIWTCLLSGLVFSRLLFSERTIDFISEFFSLIFIAMLTLLVIIPELYMDGFSITIHREFARIPSIAIGFFILAVELVIAFRGQPLSQDSDYVSTLLFALIMGFLLLFAVVIESTTELSFPVSIATTLGIGIGFTACITLAWAPFSKWGLGTVIARHLFPTNVSLEKWAQRMSNLAMVAEDADQFLASATSELRSVAGLERIEWRIGKSSSSTEGSRTRHRMSHELSPLVFTLYSRRYTSHIRALVNYFRLEVLVHFYSSKLREVRYAKEQGSLIIRETGLRLSHDIKNILHSIKAIGGLSGTASDEKIASLARNQLPEIGRRLEDALKTIDQPELEKARATQRISALLWWGRTTKRFEHIIDHLELDDGIDERDMVPARLYDRAAENFVSNALKKKETEHGLKITIALHRLASGGIGLSVTDTGTGIGGKLATRLFHAKTKSFNGAGIGLFDLHGEACEERHEVALDENCQGKVRFSIRPQERLGQEA